MGENCGYPVSEKNTLCLGIESTAHTFGVSIAESILDRCGGMILSDVKGVYKPPQGSGIHPREAAAHHSQVASKILKKALDEAGVKIQETQAIGYSAGPGLGPCLRIGAVVARTLATYYHKPLVPVNHAIGHIELSSVLTCAKDPLVLLVSGGHTTICGYSNGRWRVFGETLDLTVGQLLDQFGREAGFSSPSGAKIEELAKSSSKYIPLPYTVKGNDVSFSGLLTAAKKLLHSNVKLEDLCYSIQENAFAMLVEVVERALAFGEKCEVMLVGGVAANLRLKTMLEGMCKRHSVILYVVPKEYSGDCGAQIAWTGLLAHRYGLQVDVLKSKVIQAWRLDEVDIPWRK